MDKNISLKNYFQPRMHVMKPKDKKRWVIFQNAFKVFSHDVSRQVSRFLSFSSAFTWQNQP